MEKENKKAREDARREYNDTVRVGRSLGNGIVTLTLSSPLCCLFENETHGIGPISRPSLNPSPPRQVPILEHHRPRQDLLPFTSSRNGRERVYRGRKTFNGRWQKGTTTQRSLNVSLVGNRSRARRHGTVTRGAKSTSRMWRLSDVR